MSSTTVAKRSPRRRAFFAVLGGPVGSLGAACSRYRSYLLPPLSAVVAELVELA